MDMRFIAYLAGCHPATTGVVDLHIAAASRSPGLHDSACVAGALHGKPTAHSEGLGAGARFALVLPLAAEGTAPSSAERHRVIRRPRLATPDRAVPHVMAAKTWRFDRRCVEARTRRAEPFQGLPGFLADETARAAARPLLQQASMRRHTLALLASIALSLSGCTLLGAGGGTLIGAARAHAHPDAHISIENHTGMGIAIGVVADALAIGLVLHRLENMRFGSDSSCQGCD